MIKKEIVYSIETTNHTNIWMTGQRGKFEHDHTVLLEPEDILKSCVNLNDMIETLIAIRNDLNKED